MRNPAGHFPERREPLRGVRALLCRGSLPERSIKRPVEPVVLSTIGLKIVVIRMGDVWHDTDPGWRLGINWKLLLDHRSLTFFRVSRASELGVARLPDALAAIGGMEAAERRLL